MENTWRGVKVCFVGHLRRGSVDTVSTAMDWNWTGLGSTPVRRAFSLLRNVQTGLAAHPDSQSTGTDSYFPWGKAAVTSIHQFACINEIERTLKCTHTVRLHNLHRNLLTCMTWNDAYLFLSWKARKRKPARARACVTDSIYHQHMVFLVIQFISVYLFLGNSEFINWLINIYICSTFQHHAFKTTEFSKLETGGSKFRGNVGTNYHLTRCKKHSKPSPAQPPWQVRLSTRWFKYDRDWLCVNKSQFVPVIFQPPCTKCRMVRWYREFKPTSMEVVVEVLSHDLQPAPQ
jgi:hypothetical protein